MLPGNASGTAATVTGAAQTNITSLGTLTTLTVDDITINGSTMNGTGDLTFDAAGDDFFFTRDGGNARGNLQANAEDFSMKCTLNNGDIIFKGIDGGNPITALTLDMGEAGAATFNSTVNGLTLASGGVTGPDGSNFTLNTANSFRINIDSNASATGESFIVGHNQTAINQSNILFKVQDNGYAEFTGASDLRVTFGSTGTAGNNDANWVRGEGSSLAFNAASTSHKWEIGGTAKMSLSSAGILQLQGSNNTEGLKLGTNQRIYGAGDARAIEASSTTLQIGEGYSSSTGVMVGGTGAAFFKRIGSNQGSIFFQQGGIGATANLDSLPTMLMSAAYDNADLEGLKFWVACSASEWRPCVIHAIGATTQNTLTGQTAGWATLRCTHHAGSIQGSVMDSGGGGTFAVNDLGGGTGNSDIEMQVTYTQNGNNRTVISAWCANYGTISGVVRS